MNESTSANAIPTLHELLDWRYGLEGDELLRQLLDDGANPELRGRDRAETALHVAARRRRPVAVALLIEHGAELDARTAGGKTAVWPRRVASSIPAPSWFGPATRKRTGCSRTWRDAVPGTWWSS